MIYESEYQEWDEQFVLQHWSVPIMNRKLGVIQQSKDIFIILRPTGEPTPDQFKQDKCIFHQVFCLNSPQLSLPFYWIKTNIIKVHIFTKIDCHYWRVGTPLFKAVSVSFQSRFSSHIVWKNVENSTEGKNKQEVGKKTHLNSFHILHQNTI